MAASNRPPKKPGPKKPASRKPAGGGGAAPQRVRTLATSFLMCAMAVVVGVLVAKYHPQRLFLSSTPAPVVRSSTRPPGVPAAVDTQPAGTARRARAAEAESAALPSAAPRPPGPRPSPPAAPASAAPSAPASPHGDKAVATPKPEKTVAIAHPPPRPSAVPDAKAAIIIDDCGNNNTPTQAFLDAPAPVTLAILPHLAFSRQIARAAHEHKKGVMLHFPMEASGGQNPGPGTVKVAMTDEQKQKLIADNLAAVPDLEGVNNHEGSKATTDAHTMQMVLKAVRDRGMFWIDSYTTPDSCAYEVAAKLGLPFARRDIFLDNVDEIEPIKEQLRLLIREARARGTAIGIGHARTTTATAFVEMIPAFEEAGVKLVLVRDLTYVPQPTKEEKR